MLPNPGFARLVLGPPSLHDKLLAIPDTNAPVITVQALLPGDPHEALKVANLTYRRCGPDWKGVVEYWCDRPQARTP